MRTIVKFKAMLLIGLIELITGCGSGGQSDTLSVMETNFEGTWRVHKESKYYSVRHNEYLRSDFDESRMYFREEEGDPNTFIIDSCLSFSNDSLFRTAERDTSGLIVEGEPATFRLTAFEELQSEHTFEWEFADEDVRVVEVTTLQKESEDFLLDSGTLMVSTPAGNYEGEHVCLERSYNNNSPAQSFWLTSPIGSDSIQIGIILNNSLDSNSYRSAEEFWVQRKTAYVVLYAPGYEPAEKNLNLNILEHSSSLFRGDFLFKDEYSSDAFSGEFEALF